MQLLENAGLVESLTDTGLIASGDGDAKALAENFMVGIARHRLWEREVTL